MYLDTSERCGVNLCLSPWVNIKLHNRSAVLLVSRGWFFFSYSSIQSSWAFSGDASHFYLDLGVWIFFDSNNPSQFSWLNGHSFCGGFISAPVGKSLLYLTTFSSQIALDVALSINYDQLQVLCWREPSPQHDVASTASLNTDRCFRCDLQQGRSS